MPQATHDHNTRLSRRQAIMGAALVVPAAALASGWAGAAQAKTIVTLEREWRRWTALANAAATDEELDALCDECDRRQNLIIDLPAETMADVAAKLRMTEYFVDTGTEVTAGRLVRSLLADIAALS